MHNPVDIQPFLESSGVLGIHIGAPAIGRTTSPQRGMEGFQMIGRNLCSGNRLCGIGMLWIRGLVFWTFAAALMPLRPFVLEPHFDPFAERLLGPPPPPGSAVGTGMPGRADTPFRTASTVVERVGRPPAFGEASAGRHAFERNRHLAGNFQKPRLYTLCARFLWSVAYQVFLRQTAVPHTALWCCRQPFH